MGKWHETRQMSQEGRRDFRKGREWNTGARKAGRGTVGLKEEEQCKAAS